MLKRILLPSLAAALSMAGLFLYWNANGWTYLDLLSMLLVPVAGTVYVFLMHGWRPGLRAWTAPLDPAADAAGLRSADAYWKAQAASWLWFALGGGLVSLIDMFKNLADKTQIGPRLAVCVISLLYAALLMLLLALPYRSLIRRRLAGPEAPGTEA